MPNWKRQPLDLKFFIQFDFTLFSTCQNCPYSGQHYPSALHNIHGTNFILHRRLKKAPGKVQMERRQVRAEILLKFVQVGKRYKCANLTLLKPARQIHKRRMEAKRKMFIFFIQTKESCLVGENLGICCIRTDMMLCYLSNRNTCHVCSMTY